MLDIPRHEQKNVHEVHILDFFFWFSYEHFECVWISSQLFHIVLGARFLIFVPPFNVIVTLTAGLVENFFGMSSFCWTTMLSFYLFYITRYGKIPFLGWQTHIMCWGLPLLSTLLPLTTSNYGRILPAQWCLIESRDDNIPNQDALYYFWTYFAFFGWLILFIILQTVWGTMSFIRINARGDATLSALVSQAYDKVNLVSYFPHVMIVSVLLLLITRVSLLFSWKLIDNFCILA